MSAYLHCSPTGTDVKQLSDSVRALPSNLVTFQAKSWFIDIVLYTLQMYPNVPSVRLFHVAEIEGNPN